jgi:hypothetical protein
MEESRLKPMAVGYDPVLFNTLFKKTEALRRKLASEISYQRFGVDYQEVLAWFSVKFIHVFNKYHDKKNADLLLGDLINSLKNFKCRVLRKAYTVKYSQSIISISDPHVLESHNFYEPQRDDYQLERLEQIKSFFKQNLSDNAYLLFELQNNPPYYIIHKVRKQEIPSLHKIPDGVICDYLGLDVTDKTLRYISNLKKEIRNTLSYAKNHFQGNLIPS